MEMDIPVWIARDSDGSLWITFSEPKKQNMSLASWWSSNGTDVSGTSLDREFETLKFGDGPVCMHIK